MIGTLFRRKLDEHQTFFAMGESLAHLNYLAPARIRASATGSPSRAWPRTPASRRWRCHGRTRADRFTGEVEYATIRAICAAVDIPVFANGDIESPEKAAAVLELTGAEGLMIGRAAQGNPWIFREVRHYLEHGERLPAPTPEEVLAVMERHLAQLHRSYGEPIGVRVARKHIGWYLDGRPGAEQARRLLMRAASAAEQFGLLRAWFAGFLHENPQPDREAAPVPDSHAADSDGRRAA